MRIEAQLARWRVPPKWLTASAAAGGVVNSYAQPGQLGADRWAALVAARKRALAMEPSPASRWSWSTPERRSPSTRSTPTAYSAAA